MAKVNTPNRITPAFGFQYVDRSLHEGLARRQFGRCEQQLVIDELGPDCVYCGSAEVARWDHLVAATQNGESIIGNFVPACASCDDSKGSRPFQEWMKSSSPKSPLSRGVVDIDLRVARLVTHQTRYSYVPVSLDDRLTRDERDRLAAIREKARALRAEVEGLIADHQARVSLEETTRK